MSTPASAYPGTAHRDTALAVLFGPGQDTPAAIAQRLRSADLGAGPRPRPRPDPPADPGCRDRPGQRDRGRAAGRQPG